MEEQALVHLLDPIVLKLRAMLSWGGRVGEALVKVAPLSRAGDTEASGYVGQLKYLETATPMELAELLGLPEDDYRDGAAILLLAEFPRSLSDFECHGYTNVPGEPPDPNVPRTKQYKRGLGCPQWKLTRPLPVAGRIILGPGERFQGRDLYPIELFADGVVAGEYPPYEPFPILAATSTKGERNTIRLPLLTMACWRMNDATIEIGKSFLLPELRFELSSLGKVLKDHPKSPLSIFGHADPVGNGGESTTLSGRRAAAVYGLLTRDTSVWEKLYINPAGTDNWGFHVIQEMLTALKCAPGSIDGLDGLKTQAAVRRFQKDKKLTETGIVDKSTRTTLFASYMAFLADGIPPVPRAQFLAQGKDAGGKGDYQGCGEFNPVLRESAALAERFKDGRFRSGRTAFHQANRRVVVLFFAPGSEADPEKWHCPRVGGDASAAACKRRFFTDHEQRATPSESTRTFEGSLDTFRCRFYQRLSGASPCERGTSTHCIRLLLQDEHGNALKDKEYSLKIDGKPTSGVRSTNANGIAELVFETSAETGVLRIDHHTWHLKLGQVPSAKSEAGQRILLANHGYFPDGAKAAGHQFAFARREQSATELAIDQAAADQVREIDWGINQNLRLKHFNPLRRPQFPGPFR